MKKVRLESRVESPSGTYNEKTVQPGELHVSAKVQSEVTNDFRRWVFLEARESYGDAFTPQT